MKASPELAAVLREWDRAEYCVKIAEQITGQVPIPCIMELRYAGRRIGDAFRALEADSADTANEFLSDARFDCLRAQHDAVDVSVNYIARFIDQVMIKSRPRAIAGYYDDLSEMIEAISKMQERIALSRKDRSQRSALYAEIADELVQLKGDFDKFKVKLVEILRHSDEYIASMTEYDETLVETASNAKRFDWILRLGVALTAVVSIAVALLSI